MKSDPGFEDGEDTKGFLGHLREHGMIKQEIKEEEVKEEEVKQEDDEDGGLVVGYAGMDGASGMGEGVGNSIVISD